MKYDFTALELKWQAYWKANDTFVIEDDFEKPKYYVLDMFPYPSGEGLHVGHPEGYTATDIVARFKRMNGFNVLHPMGWDAFGLPAERYAMKTGIHPSITTKKNIQNFKRQLQSLGFSYDWSREINTTDEHYYKWTQWIFLKIFNSYYDKDENKARDISELPIPAELNSPEKEQERNDYIDSKRLAYIDRMPVNWCAELGTVLANEEVDEWVEKGYRVERKPMSQWMLRITEYAERLLDDLKFVDWPHGTLELQKNWIGRSEGAELDFHSEDNSKKLSVFTTRPDTLFGVTYMVLAPEHSLVDFFTTDEHKADVEKYTEAATLKSDFDRQLEAEKGAKTGIFTGGYVINPLSGEKVPVWIADYVLITYGTGAIMAVPGHDQRDYDFAKAFDIPVKFVISSDGKPYTSDSEAFTENGISIDSGFITGLKSKEAIQTMIEHLEKEKIGFGKIQYRLRDWLFSRQRYWGEPIPISTDSKSRYHYDKELPLKLPPSDDFKPAGTGESPLANILDWVEYKDDQGNTYKRETNTMPQWAGSSWYYLRFADPKNFDNLIDAKNEKYWLGDTGVDLYVGGAEHAVLHLLYARFWHKVLYDYGLVTSCEPFKKLVHQGLILGTDGSKMSKSRGNVVSPDDVVASHGADAFRLFEMFMGPLEQMKPWSERGIEGVYRFLTRVWRLYITDSGELEPGLLVETSDEKQKNENEKILHQTIQKVTEDIEKLSFNTAISQMMVFMNNATQHKNIGKLAAETFVKLLSPFAPHICEELWEKLGNKETVLSQPWPVFNKEKTQESTMEFVIQVNGKVRAKIIGEAGTSEDTLKQLALEQESVKRHIDGKEIRKIIVVKNRLVNIVV
ncbi:MAG: leucine--tRNA ligase [Leptospirales bacterium]